MATNRNNSIMTLTAQAAGTVNGDDQMNENCRGVQVVVDITVATTTSVVFTIQGKDAVSGKYYDLLSSAALVATGTTVYTVYPGQTAAANVSVSAPLPRQWRVKAVVTGGSSALTATVAANLIV